MKPVIGISACLAGQQVRYNGSSMKHSWIEDDLAKHAELVPCCPEMAMGLGSPRNAMRLVRTEAGIRLKEVNSDKDLTDLAEQVSTDLAAGLPQLDAYILAAKSPTCGLERIKVYSAGVPFNDGTGIFARKLTELRPDLLVIESGRLHNEELRDQFLKALFTMARFNRITKSRSALQEFHRRHKFSLLAHHPEKMRLLGRIAAAGDSPVEDQFSSYRRGLVELLKIQPSRGRIVNALEHMYGFVKETPDGQKKYFFETLEKFRTGKITADIPLKLLEMIHAGQPHSYLREQFAWRPVGDLEIRHVI
jgi:uncharacterized protein YbbK (DUF523 family)/uncharacterized protein YbgA (DUF1722 family)